MDHIKHVFANYNNYQQPVVYSTIQRPLQQIDDTNKTITYHYNTTICCTKYHDSLRTKQVSAQCLLLEEKSQTTSMLRGGKRSTKPPQPKGPIYNIELTVCSACSENEDWGSIFQLYVETVHQHLSSSTHLLRYALSQTVAVRFASL